ncbi:MAG: hypothetical protein DRN20_05315 [Thermoplasmata archaeon]|nr:MAG: hypothetical protein DRN20_05315 [Thermoplasmata archaeon]
MNKMEKTKLRKIILAIVSVVVTIGVIAYLSALPKPVSEKSWYYFAGLLFLYWIIFINWYIKRKRKSPQS